MLNQINIMFVEDFAKENEIDLSDDNFIFDNKYIRLSYQQRIGQGMFIDRSIAEIVETEWFTPEKLSLIKENYYGKKILYDYGTLQNNETVSWYRLYEEIMMEEDKKCLIEKEEPKDHDKVKKIIVGSKASIKKTLLNDYGFDIDVYDDEIREEKLQKIKLLKILYALKYYPEYNYNILKILKNESLENSIYMNGKSRAATVTLRNHLMKEVSKEFRYSLNAIDEEIELWSEFDNKIWNFLISNRDSPYKYEDLQYITNNLEFLNESLKIENIQNVYESNLTEAFYLRLYELEKINLLKDQNSIYEQLQVRKRQYKCYSISDKDFITINIVNVKEYINDNLDEVTKYIFGENTATLADKKNLKKNINNIYTLLEKIWQHNRIFEIPIIFLKIAFEEITSDFNEEIKVSYYDNNRSKRTRKSLYKNLEKHTEIPFAYNYYYISSFYERYNFYLDLNNEYEKFYKIKILINKILIKFLKANSLGKFFACSRYFRETNMCLTKFPKKYYIENVNSILYKETGFSFFSKSPLIFSIMEEENIDLIILIEKLKEIILEEQEMVEYNLENKIDFIVLIDRMNKRIEIESIIVELSEQCIEDMEKFTFYDVLK